MIIHTMSQTASNRVLYKSIAITIKLATLLDSLFAMANAEAIMVLKFSSCEKRMPSFFFFHTVVAKTSAKAAFQTKNNKYKCNKTFSTTKKKPIK